MIVAPLPSRRPTDVSAASSIYSQSSGTQRETETETTGRGKGSTDPSDTSSIISGTPGTLEMNGDSSYPETQLNGISINVPDGPTPSSSSPSSPKDVKNKDGDSEKDSVLKSLRAEVADLSSQVHTLNAKLVNSFHRISDLEDEKERAEALVERVKVLDQEKLGWEQAIEGGSLVERSQVQTELTRLMDKVLEETAHRTSAEAAKSAIEHDLDDLSSSLFNEANKMVAAERIARAQAEQKMKSLEDTVKDMQEMLDAVRESLQDEVEKRTVAEEEEQKMKEKLEGMGDGVGSSSGLLKPPGAGIENGEGEDVASVNAIYSDGQVIVASDGSSAGDQDRDASQFSTQRRGVTLPSPGSHFPRYLTLINSVSPAHPLPPLMVDIVPYTEFVNFTRHLRRLRVATLAEAHEKQIANATYYYSSYSLSHAASAGAAGAARSSPTTPTAGAPAPWNTPLLDPRDVLAPILPLSQHLGQQFVKRSVEEDSDPTLRLDLAPGLSWLTRRQISSSILDGNLVIEPAFGPLPSGTCSMCGTALERWAGAGMEVENNSATSRQVSTVRKMISGGSWSFGSRSKKPSKDDIPSSASLQSGLSSASTSRPHSPAATAPVFNFPSGPEKPANQQIHIFRATEGSNSRYALCPTYCLPRLRAACEFWGYIRSISRGLLLEEYNFLGAAPPQIKRDRVSSAATAPGSTRGFRRSLSGRSLEKLTSEKGNASMDSLTESERPTDSSTPPKTPTTAETSPQTPASPVDGEPEKNNGGGDVGVETTAESPIVENEDTKTISESPQIASSPLDPMDSSSSAPPPSGAPPVRPKRSTARAVGSNSGSTTPPVVTTTAPSPDPPRPDLTQEPKAREPPLPSGGLPTSINPSPKPPPALPPRSVPASKSLTTLDETSTSQTTTTQSSSTSSSWNGGLAAGWEDRCWVEVIRLRELMFWARMAASTDRPAGHSPRHVGNSHSIS